METTFSGLKKRARSLKKTISTKKVLLRILNKNVAVLLTHATEIKHQIWASNF